MTDTILIERLEGNYGDIGRIQLNAPKSLNALTLDMVSAIKAQLAKWQKDKTIAGVWIDSVSEKAFCAGGDVVGIYKDQANPKQPSTPDLAKAFFKAEYQNNQMIHHYKKPIVFWGHGLVLGGGVGLLANGQYRIATESSRFSWPEIKIGLFPDVGGGFYLGRLPKHYAYLMGVGGVMINASEAKQFGLIDHCLKSDMQEKVLTLFCEHLDDEEFELSLEKLEKDATAPESRIDDDKLKALFQQDDLQESIQGILQLDADMTDANSLIAELKRNVEYGSPLSAMVFAEQYQRCQSLDYDEVIALEYKIACGMTGLPDFYEGVRALLVEKDNSPTWTMDWNHTNKTIMKEIFDNDFTID